MRKMIKQINLNLINKSYTEGIYTDNAQNRKLGRVGMSYGKYSIVENWESEKDDGENFATNPKQILVKMKNKLSEEGIKLLENIFSNESFTEGDITYYEGKIYINKTTEINPIQNKDIINLGNERGESKQTESQKEYLSKVDAILGKDAILKDLLETTNKTVGNTTTKFRSVLSVLKSDYDSFYRTQLSMKKSYLSEKDWNLYKKYRDNEEKINELVSEEEAYNYAKEDSYNWRNYYSYTYRKYNLFKQIKQYIDLSKEEIETEENKENFKKFLINCPRKDFYEILKESINNKDTYTYNKLLRGRFHLKYNKTLIGDGWDYFYEQNNKGKLLFSPKKRDDILSLAQQIEHCVDDVLKDNKNIFINNPNVVHLNYSRSIDWGGCSYNSTYKEITITDDYFQGAKYGRKEWKDIPTMSREKFMIEALVHELGHSTDLSDDIKNSEFYKDFAKHLGFEKNKDYTIFVNAIKNKEDANFFENEDSYFCIEKDAKQDLIDKFKPLFDKSIVEEWEKESENSIISNLYISSYSNKSACEGYAEYFSFYMCNKDKIDKDIKKYKENPQVFLDSTNIKDWYKYHTSLNKWNSLVTSDNLNKKEYYKKVLKHNIEMLIDIQKIVKILKVKYKD